MSLQRQHKGSVLVYAAITMVVLVGFVSLGVDVGHARLVKTQLQGAADAAVRAAAAVLSSGVNASSNAAVATAAANTADGSSVVVNPNTDIDFGTWSSGTFTMLTGGNQANANAIRVRCTRSASRGNAVQLMFAPIIGVASEDITVQATATSSITMMAGFIGYGGITVKNNTFFGGYNSAVTTSPTEQGADSNMRVGSNSIITAKNNDTIEGNVVLGPSGTSGGFSVSGSTIVGPVITTPTMPPWSPGTNPGSTPQDYTASSDTTLPGGTYWFTSLTINANVTFSSASVVYVNGPIAIGGTLAPTSGVPSDLTIYQYGSTTFGDAASNGMNITAEVVAPSSDFTAKNNLYYAGSGIFNSITTKNNADFFYDEAEGPANGTYKVAMVK